MDKYSDALSSLKNYIELEEYRGYDPYDTLNSFLPFGIFGKWGRVIAIQLQKRNPVNIRPLIGIKKEINPKAMGLFLHSYSLLQRGRKEDVFMKQMKFIFDWLQNNYSKGYSGHCWGYNFVWASTQKTLSRFHPSIVVTSFICKGIYEYYLTTKDEKAIELLKSASNYIIKDLPLTETKDGICFAYTDVMKDCCYNAGMLGAEVLAKLYSITGDAQLKDLALRSADFLVAHQHEDGHWNYDINPATGREKVQIDFHQGYVIDSLAEVAKHCDPHNVMYKDAVRKGLMYYRNVQFTSEGRSLWRIPKKYPVEIHNQSQGIITFTRHRKDFPEYFPFGKTVADFTIENMHDKKLGYFYYRSLPAYKNKIPFMRWSQAWMMLALTELIVAENPDRF